jgi:hypothetical protein
MKVDGCARRDVRQAGILMQQQDQLGSLKLATLRFALANQPTTLLDKVDRKPWLGERCRTGHRATPFARIVLVTMPNRQILTQKTRLLQPYTTVNCGTT